MKCFSTFVFYLIYTFSLNAQVKIIDLSTGDPLVFATIMSMDSLFHANINAKGEFQFPPNIDFFTMKDRSFHVINPSESEKQLRTQDSR